MRKLILLGTIGMSVVFGAANAYAITANSPYAIWEPQAVDVQMNEGRAAYDENGAMIGRRGPTWEESTAYSRGK
jgi:hypothetical protein